MFSVLLICCNGVIDYIYYYDDFEWGYYDKVICLVVSNFFIFFNYVIYFNCWKIKYWWRVVLEIFFVKKFLLVIFF